MTEAKKRVFNPTVETRLARTDITRLDEAAKTAGKSRSDFMRQILLWYLDNQEKVELDKRETEVAEAMNAGTPGRCYRHPLRVELDGIAGR
jgi:uncharacterized protein (DUF1778 family)